MASNILEMKPKQRGTALERIAQRLRMKTAKTVELPRRSVEPSVVYGERGDARLTTNTLMARLLSREDL